MYSRTRFYLLFTHDAQLGQPFEVLRLGSLLWKLLWGRPSCVAQRSLLLRSCYTYAGHGIRVSPPTNNVCPCALLSISLSSLYPSTTAQSSGCEALLWTLILNSRVESTEDCGHGSRNEGRTVEIRESNNTLTTPTETHKHTGNTPHVCMCVCACEEESLVYTFL